MSRGITYSTTVLVSSMSNYVLSILTELGCYMYQMYIINTVFVANEVELAGLFCSFAWVLLQSEKFKFDQSSNGPNQQNVLCKEEIGYNRLRRNLCQLDQVWSEICLQHQIWYFWDAPSAWAISCYREQWWNCIWLEVLFYICLTRHSTVFPAFTPSLCKKWEDKTCESIINERPKLFCPICGMLKFILHM